jgi:hypothetical protein
LKAEFQDLQLYFEKDLEVCVFSPLYTTVLWNMWIALFHLHSQIHVVSNWWSLDHNPMLLDWLSVHKKFSWCWDRCFLRTSSLLRLSKLHLLLCYQGLHIYQLLTCLPW